jgi:hypothetical protein
MITYTRTNKTNKIISNSSSCDSQMAVDSFLVLWAPHLAPG